MAQTDGAECHKRRARKTCPVRMASSAAYCSWEGLKLRASQLDMDTCNNQSINQSINKSINIFNVLGGNWDPTVKRFSSVNSHRQDLFSTCKAFPEEATTCIWFIQSHKVCNSTTVLQEVQHHRLDDKHQGHMGVIVCPTQLS